MASDKRLQDPVASECHDGAVVGMRLVIFVRVGFEAVVEAGCVVVDVDGVEFRGGHHFSEIPELHHLIFAV